MVHNPLDYFVLGQLPQNCRQFAVVRVPQLNTRRVYCDEHEEFPVEEHVERRVFVNQVLVLGFVVILLDQLLEPADDAVVWFSDGEALHIVRAHVECLHAG